MPGTFLIFLGAKHPGFQPRRFFRIRTLDSYENLSGTQLLAHRLRPLTSGEMAKVRKGHGAQNQHYVPKFILRNFLSNPEREQVSVFDKQRGEPIPQPLSIKGIMAERRFHDFQIGAEYVGSFEAAAGKLEDHVLPTYRRVLAKRRLSHDPEEHVNLALLVAFQFIRTRAIRERFVEFEEQIASKVRALGGTMDQVQGWRPLTEDRLKHQHMQFMVNALPKFMALVAQKHFILFEPPEGRSYYLSDNPVTLYNSVQSDRVFGSIGLGVKGIEIYLPLASDLLLAAWCPSLLYPVLVEGPAQLKLVQDALLRRAMARQISPAEMKGQLDEIAAIGAPLDKLAHHYKSGVPMAADQDNMDFYNSQQMSQCSRFVVCKESDFALASRFVRDFPEDCQGKPLVPGGVGTSHVPGT